MESDRGLVKMPSLAKKSMNFLRDAYNMAPHSGSSSPSTLGAHNQHSFQPSQGLSHHFGQSSQQQQYLPPNMHVHSNSWSGPQTHSTPNLGAYPLPPGLSSLNPPVKPSTQWSTQNAPMPSTTQEPPPPPPYSPQALHVSQRPSRQSSQHSFNNQQQQKPVPVQVFSPDDYHEIWQSESAHNVPRPPQRTTSTATSAPTQQQYQTPILASNHSSGQQPQYPANMFPSQQSQAPSPPTQQHPIYSPPSQQFQAHSPPTQQYSFAPQQQPFVPLQGSQQSSQQQPPLQHSYSYPTTQQHQVPYQQQLHAVTYSTAEPSPSIYPIQGYYQHSIMPSQPYYSPPPSSEALQQPHHSQSWPQMAEEQQAQPHPPQAWTQYQSHYQDQPSQADSNYFSYHSPPSQAITSPVPAVAVSPPPVAEMLTPNLVQAHHQTQQQYQPSYAQQPYSDADGNATNQYQHQYEYYGPQQQQYNASQSGNEYQHPAPATYQHPPYHSQAYQKGSNNFNVRTDSMPPAASTQIPLAAVAELPG